MKFAKDLGPTTQIVYKRKLEGGVAETPACQITTSNFNLQSSNIEQGWGSHYPDGFHQIQPPTEQSGLIHGGNVQLGAQVSNLFKLTRLGVDEASSSHIGNVNHGGQISSWFESMELGMEPIPDTAGPCIGGSIQPGGQISSCFKPTELGLEPIPEASGPSQGGNKPTELWSEDSEPSSDDWLQEHCAPFADLNMSSQAEPLQLNGWTITPYDSHTTLQPMNNNSCIMSSGELRRSSRITELEARRAEQEKSKKERKLAGAQETGTKKVPKKKRGNEKRKNGPVPDLDGTSTGQDHYTFDADVAFGIALPSKEKLMQVLDRLQQKDKNGYFAEPVDANEVEHYYDVITEPMDFSTIVEKIDGGSYETFTDFVVCSSNSCFLIVCNFCARSISENPANWKCWNQLLFSYFV